MEREKFEFAGDMKNFRSPAVLLRGGFDVAQDSADVNGLAVVTAMIFAQLLHTENFTQRREDAKKFFDANCTN